MTTNFLAQVIDEDGTMHTVIEERDGIWRTGCTCGWKTTVDGYFGRKQAKEHVQRTVSDSLVQLVGSSIEFI